MNILNKIRTYFGKEKNDKSAPLFIINKNTNDLDVREYDCIEKAIEDLKNDPNVPKEKIEKLKASIDKLKHKGSIKIKNGEIIE